MRAMRPSAFSRQGPPTTESGDPWLNPRGPLLRQVEVSFATRSSMVYIGPVPLVGRERGDESGRKRVGEKDRGREEKKEEGREWKKGKGKSGRKIREGGEGVEGMKRRRDEKKEGEGRGRKEGWGKRRRRREEEEGEKNGTKNLALTRGQVVDVLWLQFSLSAMW
jgi:hypothetical protein